MAVGRFSFPEQFFSLSGQFPCSLTGFGPGYKINRIRAGQHGFDFYLDAPAFPENANGSVFMALFFQTLSFAAFSSLISMFVLVTRMLNDWGISQKQTILWIAVIGFLLGIPSAANITFFENQDWVWGLGLMLNGFFLTIIVCKYGATRFRLTIIDSAQNDFSTGRW